MTMIASHATGHGWATDGILLRVDCDRGIGWVATHYDLNLRVIQQVRGPDEEVQRSGLVGTGLGGAMRFHLVDLHRGIRERNTPRDDVRGLWNRVCRKPKRVVNVEL
jgi:hypothetical protein